MSEEVAEGRMSWFRRDLLQSCVSTHIIISIAYPYSHLFTSLMGWDGSAGILQAELCVGGIMLHKSRALGRLAVKVPEASKLSVCVSVETATFCGADVSET